VGESLKPCTDELCKLHCSADHARLPKAHDITSSLFWTFHWNLIFTDNKYLRIWEHHGKKSGLQDSCRVRFTFHYGLRLKPGLNGIPIYEPSDPVDIRIDDIHEPAHIHYGQQEPRYPQDKVKGLQLDSLDMFTFARAIFRHRETGRPIAVTLGFKLDK
jgi:hypothetical protein